jgi:hypothetical protein
LREGLDAKGSIHHCLVDGVGSVDVADLLLDSEPSAPPVRHGDGRPTTPQTDRSPARFRLPDAPEPLIQAAQAGTQAAGAAIQAALHPRDARGGELDRERHPVEPATDLRDGLAGAGVGIERARRLSGAIEEQLDRVAAGRPVRPVRTAGSVGVGVGSPFCGQPQDAEDLLAGDPERLPARRHDPERRERDSSSTTNRAHPSTTCSQLSRTRSDVSVNRRAIAAAGSLEGSAGSTIDAATCATRSASNVLDRSTHQAPPTKSGRTASASATANRVFPAPPGPHSESRRVCQTRARSSLSAA